jgi:hypothetical protein
VLSNVLEEFVADSEPLRQLLWGPDKHIHSKVSVGEEIRNRAGACGGTLSAFHYNEQVKITVNGLRAARIRTEENYLVRFARIHDPPRDLA